ncbi:NAD(P)-binding protein [Hesseltinella vesiculosa]|uniref:NAD(P)-binding protein n=1 Tax=Hesseltinella vesiculosa TaxID=101127 RepID=A0A1X2G816_9FUNG|nr:NAD(P)-binding protein [Hesseltinella vesiculosa]
MAPNKIFIVGGTGDVGSQTVKFLLAKGALLTLFARSAEKVAKLFGAHHPQISVVEGDYADLTPLQNAMVGHQRLFLLAAITVTFDFAKIKQAIAQAAYDQGVEQIVDLSSMAAGWRWRAFFSADDHWRAENAMLTIPGRKRLVIIRPGRFMSTLVQFDAPAIRLHNALQGTDAPQDKSPWISSKDIAELASVVLTEDPAKHGDMVYEMVGDLLTYEETAQVFTRVLGRPITYQVIDPVARYKLFTEKIGLPHSLAYNLAALDLTVLPETRGLPILLGRSPESLEAYLTEHKHAFK